MVKTVSLVRNAAVICGSKAGLRCGLPSSSAAVERNMEEENPASTAFHTVGLSSIAEDTETS
jgi:hypothetical protein